MPIDMNWSEVGKVAASVKTMTEQTVTRLNAGLASLGTAAGANPGFATSAALLICEQNWSVELGDLVRRTMVAADKLDDSALTIKQADEENARAAEAMVVLR